MKMYPSRRRAAWRASVSPKRSRESTRSNLVRIVEVRVRGADVVAKAMGIMLRCTYKGTVIRVISLRYSYLRGYADS